MASALEFAESKQLEAIDPSKIQAVMDLDVELVAPAHGNYRNRLEGALDEAKTCHWTVYIPEGYETGDFTVTRKDLRPNTGSRTDGVRISGDKKVTIFTFDTKSQEDPDNLTVVFYTPAQAVAPEELTVKF